MTIHNIDLFCCFLNITKKSTTICPFFSISGMHTIYLMEIQGYKNYYSFKCNIFTIYNLISGAYRQNTILKVYLLN